MLPKLLKLCFKGVTVSLDGWGRFGKSKAVSKCMLLTAFVASDKICHSLTGCGTLIA